MGAQHVSVDRGPVATPAAKVRRPRLDERLVSRGDLFNAAAIDGTQVVAVVAPAGFGKTTILAQWCSLLDGPVAWAHLDSTDSDPLVLMSTVIAALLEAGCLPADAREYLEGITADEPAFSRRVLPTFQTLLERIENPVTLVLDDIDNARIDDPSVPVALVASLPAGSRLVLAGRSLPPTLPIARWRGQGSLYEVGPEQLALRTAEVSELIATLSGVAPTDTDAQAVLDETHGWPVAVYLALTKSGPAAPVTGSGGPIRGYLRSEVLAGLDPTVMEFLRSTSVLSALSAALCDDVLARTDSHTVLETVAASNPMLAPLIGEGTWYRLHPLLREALLHDLEEKDPEGARALHSRASSWFDRHGFAETALSHAARAHDANALGDLVWRHGLPMLLAGRASTVASWFDKYATPRGAREMPPTPALSMMAAWTAMMQGRAADVVRWSDEAVAGLGENWQPHAPTNDVESGIATLVAARMSTGYQDASRLATGAFTQLPSGHLLRPLSRLLQGWSLALSGRICDGHELITHAALLSQSMDLATTWVEALSLRAIVELAQGDTEAAMQSLSTATTVWTERDLQDAAATTLLLNCATAPVEAAAGRSSAATIALDRLSELSPAVAPSLPWVNPLSAVLTARTHADLGSLDRAREATTRAGKVLAASPPSALLTDLFNDLHKRIAAATTATVLSPAEQRVAQHIDSAKTVGDIAEELGVSYETVKSHLASIYRKMGVPSRRHAAQALRNKGKP